MFPEREILGYLFPPPGVEVAGANGSRRNGSGSFFSKFSKIRFRASKTGGVVLNFPRLGILPPYPPTGNPPCSPGQQPGRNRHTRPGGRGPQSRRPVGWITTPPGKRAKMQKIQRARDGGKTAPVLRFCRQYRGRGNLIPAQGNRGGGNAASGGTGTPPAGLDFPDFPEPLKREFLQLLQYIKKGEFPEFLDTVKRGFSSGDCATIGDTFSEREKLNFLQRKKGVKSELKDPDKKGRNGSCFLCETGRFAGVYSRGGVGGCPVGLEGVQGKRGANTGTVGGVGGS